MQCTIAEKIKNSAAFRGDSGQNATKTVNSGIEMSLYYYARATSTPAQAGGSARTPQWVNMCRVLGKAQINFLELEVYITQ
jgi:hypothetical protein